MSDVDFLKRLNQRILSDLAARESLVSEREEQAARILRECSAEREAIFAKRRSILEVEALQIGALQGGGLTVTADAEPRRPEPPHPRNDEAQERKPKARVGDQRYIMLTTIREAGFLTMDDLVERTGFVLKRVKDQLRADVPEFLNEMRLPDGHGGHFTAFELTEDGTDLLHRFEEYRRSKGLPLPRLDDHSADDEADEPREGDKGESLPPVMHLPPPRSEDDYGVTSSRREDANHSGSPQPAGYDLAEQKY